MSDIAGGERRLSGDGDSSDLDITHLDGAALATAPRREAGSGHRGRLIECLHTTVEVLGEQLGERQLEAPTTLAWLE